MRRFFICGDKIQKVLIMGYMICYAWYMEGLDCKSEGQVQGIKKEVRGDVHFCNIVYTKYGYFLRKAGKNESNHTLRPSSDRSWNLRTEDINGDRKKDP